MKTLKITFTKKILGIALLLISGLLNAQVENKTTFKPLHLVISVPDVEEAANWYISKLDFVAYKKFNVPEKGLTAQLLTMGHFELMLMKSKGSKNIPEYRKNTFADLAVQGVKRIAFKVKNLDKYITKLQQKGVKIDVSPRLFEDKDNQVAFKWAIIKDNNNNLIEFVEEL